ncbi:MAG: IS3 family transposase, partial [Methylobacterium sp.]|nr:IS3 family transposase [Methylobacterium sp.]MCA3655406.1 IS3 family transposase [Methylobacterium sp.]MCA3667247.1 IS3 family transposase [Methylobacterium sp.]
MRQVLDHEHEHPSRWAAITSIAAKIGSTAQTLRAFSDPSDTGWSKKMRE